MSENKNFQSRLNDSYTNSIKNNFISSDKNTSKVTKNDYTNRNNNLSNNDLLKHQNSYRQSNQTQKTLIINRSFQSSSIEKNDKIKVSEIDYKTNKVDYINNKNIQSSKVVSNENYRANKIINDNNNLLKHQQSYIQSNQSPKTLIINRSFQSSSNEKKDKIKVSEIDYRKNKVDYIDNKVIKDFQTKTINKINFEELNIQSKVSYNKENQTDFIRYRQDIKYDLIKETKVNFTKLPCKEETKNKIKSIVYNYSTRQKNSFFRQQSKINANQNLNNNQPKSLIDEKRLNINYTEKQQNIENYVKETQKNIYKNTESQNNKVKENTKNDSIKSIIKEDSKQSTKDIINNYEKKKNENLRKSIRNPYLTKTENIDKETVRVAEVASKIRITKPLESTKKLIKDFQGSKDTGVKSAVVAKDTIIKTNKVIKDSKMMLSKIIHSDNKFKTIISTTTKANLKIIDKAISAIPENNDLGIKAVVKTKNAMNKTAQTAKFAKRVSINIYNQFKKILKITKKILSNPVVVKAMVFIGGFFGALLIMMIPVIAVGAIIPVFTLKSNELELTKTYKYVTELDVDFELEINEAIVNNRFVDSIQYFLNGSIVNRSALSKFETNADFILMYFDSKYEDYLFDKILFLFGFSVKNELTDIHKELYNMDYEVVEEEHHHYYNVCSGGELLEPAKPEVKNAEGVIIQEAKEAVYCPGGMVHSCPGGETLKPAMICPGGEILGDGSVCPGGEVLEEALICSGGSPEYISWNTKHLTIDVTAKIFEDVLDSDSWSTEFKTKYVSLSESQKESFNALKEVGSYTFLRNLASPVVGVKWDSLITSRFGWRIHPISNNRSEHNALDIALPGGHPLNAVMPGVATTGYDDSYGYYVKIQFGSDYNQNYILYAHLSGFNVYDGQLVNIGDVIGFVGSTGSSTGNHLHIEYKKEGNYLNPYFFIFCDE